ncbi:CHASE3 domain-containing protein [Yoonia sp. F2084L]|uniref:CHASE3 domain-containing protein n=1 Tax=Yoonia sp. F2084L TaxID=2926419 RepID=UPI001FF50A45|nr:CHASE3 domain-containing protein [Yoonia sp. F2084L]MCK0093934.1 CHASE3 domain-containing protein [Yoonia sp. F2084L]
MRTKIRLVALFPLLFTVGIGVIAVGNTGDVGETRKWIAHTEKVIFEGEAIVAAAVDMETGMRGFLLAGEDAFLAHYDSGKDRAYNGLTDLKQTVSDNPAQVARLGNAKTILQDWQGEVAEPMIALRREILQARTMNDVAAEVQRAEGKTYFDGFRGQIQEFIDVEETLLAQRTADFSAALNSGTASREDIQASVEWVEHTYAVIGEAKAILTAAINMETGMRGYLLAGDEQFQEPLNAGRADFQARVDALIQTVSDNPQQVVRLEEIRSTIQEWDQRVVSRMLQLRGDVLGGKSMDELAQFVGEERGKFYFDQFRGEMAAFIAEERDLLVVRQGAAVAAQTAKDRSILLAVLTTILLGGLVASMIGRSVSSAILQLAQSMKRLATGDMNRAGFAGG